MPKEKKVKKQINKQSNNNKDQVKQEARIVDRPLVEEMQQSYLDYAMSVIVSRALPDARDGLKPVHRRILYAMWDIGLKSSARFRKSATVVGEVLGKYHPHGDTAVYDSMVRMAQDFSLRYPLVNGQGNFGSMDGDGAAAMRYTEAKLSPIAEEILYDLDKDTVNFIPNYDGSQKEPQVMPAKLPNLLINGAMGIAVGMATSIPPHNISEILAATIHLINHPESTVDDLLKFVKGPDFPTGGIIFNQADIKAAYVNGKGSIVMRAKIDIVEEKSGQFQIIATELPYQLNKASLLEKIANLIRDKKIEGIKDLRDESDKDGVRVVVDLKKDAYPKKILNQLYKYTELQTSFHVNLLALVDGIQPRVLTLVDTLREYIKHRRDVVRRRTQYELDKAKDRAHILEGLAMALEDIDRIIATIKKSKDRDDAKQNLIKKFKLSDRQAIAILEMKLQQLANLERLKVEEELKEKNKIIKELTTLLKSEKKILEVVKKELEYLQDKYGDERRTQVVPHGVDSFSQEDLIPNEPTVVTVTKDGYIKRLPPDTFKVQGRGGKGVIGLTTKEEDVVEHLFTTNTHADLLFFTSKGRVFQLKAYDAPIGSRTSKGQAIVNFLQLGQEEKISSVLPISDVKAEYKFLVMVTTQGVIKKVKFDQFDNVRRSGLIAINLKGDDRLEWVKPTVGSDDIILITSKGQAVRFKEGKLRPMGRSAAGVRGIRLKKGDHVVGMDLVLGGKPGKEEQLLVVIDKGYAKRTRLTEFKVQGRGGSGIKCAKITTKTGEVVSSMIVSKQTEEEDIIVISEKGQVIRLPLKSVPILGRATQGVRVMRFKNEGDRVANITHI